LANLTSIIKGEFVVWLLRICCWACIIICQW